MKREQSWLSRHERLHRLFNAAVIAFCLWVVGSVVIGTIRGLGY